LISVSGEMKVSESAFALRAQLAAKKGLAILCLVNRSSSL